MAGIGFELYRILHKGTLGSMLKAFFLGTMIVAGPWILSVLSIYIIQKYASAAISENPDIFTVTIVYIYAFSLSLFGGIHYVFSRYIADMLYIEDDKSIPSSLITIFIITIFLSVLISGVFVSINNFHKLKFPEMYKFSLILLFTVVNLIWIMLIYVSLLKEYNKIFISYLTGIIVSIGGVFYFGKTYGVSGALLGYTCGQFLIIVLLFIVSQRLYPTKSFRFNFQLIKYFKEFKYLFALGMFFNISIWIDKMIYWVAMGAEIEGTLYRYYISYDVPVFLAFITMIPGLVYFLVISEPIFHTAYFKFVKNILEDTLATIKENKSSMIKNLKLGLTKLILFQGICTLALLLNTEQFLSFMGYEKLNTVIMNILLVAVFFHMLALTLQTYMLYLEMRKEAVISTLIYMLSNLSLTLIFIFLNAPIPGVSFMIAAMITSIYSGFYVARKAPIIDYIIFNRT